MIDFVDDWLIISPSKGVHFHRLEKLFGEIRKHEITVKFEKIKLFRKEMRFLEHILTTESIKTDPAKVEGIRNYHPLKNMKQLPGFLGLMNFCSKFMVELAHVTLSLLELLRASSGPGAEGGACFPARERTVM